MLFEGIAAKAYACGSPWNDIKIDNIEYRLYADETSTSTSSTTRSPTTTLTHSATPLMSKSPTTYIWMGKYRQLCYDWLCYDIANSRIQIWRHRHRPVAAINMDELDDIDTLR